MPAPHLMPLPPSAAVWDPLAEPYTTRQCRGGHHQHCPGGLDYYPRGIDGPCVLVPCACDAEDCTHEVPR